MEKFQNFIKKSPEIEIISCKQCNSILTHDPNKEILQINGNHFYLLTQMTPLNHTLKGIEVNNLKNKKLSEIIRNINSGKEEIQILIINDQKPKQILKENKLKYIYYYTKEDVPFPVPFFRRTDLILEESKFDDLDCLYEEIKCLHCPNKIGRIYKTGRGRIVPYIDLILLRISQIDFQRFDQSFPLTINQMNNENDVKTNEQNERRIKQEDLDLNLGSQILLALKTEEDSKRIELSKKIDCVYSKERIKSESESKKRKNCDNQEIDIDKRESKDQKISKIDQNFKVNSNKNGKNDTTLLDIQLLLKEMVILLKEDDELIDTFENNLHSLLIKSFDQNRELKHLLKNN